MTPSRGSGGSVEPPKQRSAAPAEAVTFRFLCPRTRCVSSGLGHAGERRTRSVADLCARCQTRIMKNVQIIDGASNATYSLFQATDDEFAAIFPEGRDMETIEDLHSRLGGDEAGRVLEGLWNRPILKRDALGLHGTLFYDNDCRGLPASKREVDWDERSINPAQRNLFARHRG